MWKRLRNLQSHLVRTGKDRIIAVVFGSFTLTLGLINLDFHSLEANLFDFRTVHGPPLRPSSDIVLLAIDDLTAKKLNEFSPLPIEWHARIMEALESRNPRAVGYLVDMNRVYQSSPDSFPGDSAPRFVSAAERMEARGTSVLLGTPYDVTGEVLPPYPLSSLAHAVAIIHKDGNVFAEDQVTRRALVSLYGDPSFHLRLAQMLGRVNKDFKPRGTYSVPGVEAEYFFFRYHGSPVVQWEPAAVQSGVPAWKPKSSYTTYSVADLLEGTLPSDAIDQKVVLIGTLTREDSGDYATTPFSRSPFSGGKLGVHASILNSVLADRTVIQAPSWVNGLVTFAVTTFVILWVLNSTPLYGVFATLSLALGFAIVAQLLFSMRGVWIREAQPMIGIFLSYYVVVPYRLILEYKARWDYQRKNELLVQVEELKTNFLSLVTHDLKTPVARIQGLAEVLLRRLPTIPAQEKETLRAIITSTDDLNRFISSILELTKVESNRLHLSLESRDLNQLVERSVADLSVRAKAAGIEIVLELEPLFPIRLDPSLISKVLTNVIDNAIKYSVPGKRIWIKSSEEGAWATLSVKDEGVGMTDVELSQLFSRFYRAKNERTASVGGTGLGLYLTRYFVEAHDGKVEVESKPGEGSTFKIYLPLAGSGESLGLTRENSTQGETYVSNSNRG